MSDILRPEVIQTPSVTLKPIHLHDETKRAQTRCSLDVLKITRCVFKELNRLVVSVKPQPPGNLLNTNQIFQEATQLLFSSTTPNLTAGLRKCLNHLDHPFIATLAALCLLQGVGCMPTSKHVVKILTPHQNDPRAKALLAECYIFGKGVERNLELGLELLESAYQANDLYAHIVSGDCYRFGMYTGMPDIDQTQQEYQWVFEGDHPDNLRHDTLLMHCLANLRLAQILTRKVGIEYLQQAAKCAYPVAWYELGRVLLDEAKTDEVRMTAFTQIERAAQARYLPACVLMSQSLSPTPQSDRMPEHNLQMALRYALYAAEQGDPEFLKFATKYRIQLKALANQPQNYGQVIETLCTQAQAQEDADANCELNLGLCYHFGYGVEQDSKQAFEWYLKAANRGHAYGEFWTGYYYDPVEGTEPNAELAYKWYLMSATQGNEYGQYYVGSCYEKGHGVLHDEHQAFEWYLKSAEQGNADGQNSVGDSYYKGRGVSQNFLQAFKWYQKSAQQNHAKAQNNLGVCYKHGHGIAASHSQAFEWYLKSALQGNADAQFNLGECYYCGHGVTRDYALALEWYVKSASQGNALGQFGVGYCYEHGSGVERDMKLAFKWYEKAASQGCAQALNHLGNRYHGGKHVVKDYGKAFQWYLKAAQLGYAKGQANLGDCYFYGHGVAQDYHQALRWYRKALEQGNTSCDTNMAECYKMTGMTPDAPPIGQ